MNVINLFFKMVFKNPLTKLLLVVAIIVPLFILTQNSNVLQTESPNIKLQQEIKFQKESLAKLNRKLKIQNENKADTMLTKADILNAQSNRLENQVMLKYLNKHAWKIYYQLAYKKSLKTYNLVRKDPNSSDVMKRSLQRESLRYQALESFNGPEQSEIYPVKGIDFMTSLLRYVVPIFFTFILIFILVETYSYRYFGSIDTDRLIPTDKMNMNILKIVAGFLSSCCLVVSILLFIFFIASVFFGSGTLNYPIFNYLQGTDQIDYQTIEKLLLNIFGLQLLALIFLICLTYFISKIVKNKFSTLFIVILIEPGISILSVLLEPIQKFAAVLPTTYLFSFLTVTGELGVTTHNYRVTTKRGVLVLTFSIALLAIGIYVFDLIQQQSNKKEAFK